MQLVVVSWRFRGDIWPENGREVLETEVFEQVILCSRKFGFRLDSMQVVADCLSLALTGPPRALPWLFADIEKRAARVGLLLFKRALFETLLNNSLDDAEVAQEKFRNQAVNELSAA